MRIAVCVKQVPVVAALRFDPVSKTITRAGVPSEVSAFDIRALLKAVELRDLHGGEVVVVTMGPPQAREALEYCLALGADSALHLCDPAFAASDTLATSRALAFALRPHQFDLILCGRSSVDAETGQVGPELAELLDLPQVTAVHTLDIDPSRRSLRAERELDDGVELVETSLPCLISAAEDLAAERFPSKADRLASKQKPYTRLCASDLTPDSALFGVAGSPTWVAEVEAVAITRRGQTIAAESPIAAADELARILIEDHGLFGSWKELAEPPAERPLPPPPVASYRPIWVLLEDLAGALRPVSFELLHKARLIAGSLGTEVVALLFSTNASAYLEELGRAGVDRLLTANDPRFFPLTAETSTPALAARIAAAQPSMLLAPATSFGRDLMPRLAARLGLGLTGDCVDLALDTDGRLVQYKPAFGGSIVAAILSRTQPQMATVRPGMLSARPSAAVNPSSPRAAIAVDLLEWDPATQRRVEVLEHRASAGRATELDNAEIVVGIGKGLGEWQRYEILSPLVDLLAAGLCATRDVTDAGWLSKQYQVGITGRAISPRLYIAAGIRGAFDHLVGVRGAGLIVAINKNPKAPIFKAADYGVVGELAEVVPALVQSLLRRRPPSYLAGRPAPTL